MVASLAGGGDPMEAKRALAAAITARYHGAAAADEAGERFRAVHGRRELPDDVPAHALPDGDPLHLPALLQGLGWVSSRSEGRRRIGEGGVRLDGEPVHDLDVARERLEGGACCSSAAATRASSAEAACSAVLPAPEAYSPGHGGRDDGCRLDVDDRLPHTPLRRRSPAGERRS